MDTYVIKRNEELLSLTQEMVDKRLAQVNERLAPIFNISLKIGSSENGRAEEYKVTLPNCLRDGAFSRFLGWRCRIYTVFTPLEDRIGR